MDVLAFDDSEPSDAGGPSASCATDGESNRCELKFSPIILKETSVTVKTFNKDIFLDTLGMNHKLCENIYHGASYGILSRLKGQFHIRPRTKNFYSYTQATGYWEAWKNDPYSKGHLDQDSPVNSINIEFSHEFEVKTHKFHLKTFIHDLTAIRMLVTAANMGLIKKIVGKFSPIRDKKLLYITMDDNVDYFQKQVYTLSPEINRYNYYSNKILELERVDEV